MLDRKSPTTDGRALHVPVGVGAVSSEQQLRGQAGAIRHGKRIRVAEGNGRTKEGTIKSRKARPVKAGTTHEREERLSRGKSDPREGGATKLKKERQRKAIKQRKERL